MLRGKKGLSAIIGTLLIILLVIVAVGIVWFVLRGTLEGGAGELESGQACLSISIAATAATCTAATNVCDVTYTREAGGDEVDGIRMVISDGSNSVINDTDGNIDVLQTKTKTDINVSTLTVADISSIQIAAYFTDDAGEKTVCSGASTFGDILIA